MAAWLPAQNGSLQQPAAKEPKTCTLFARRCRNAQVFYRGSVRSGFVSFSDEDDPEVLERIRQQALKDADWVVNKV